MTAASFAERLARPIGAVWPNAEQELVLQTIFAEDKKALAAFAAWRRGIDLAAEFDRSVFRLLPLLYRRLQALGAEDPVMGRLKGVYRRAWSDTHALLHDTAPAVAALEQGGIRTMLLKGAPMVLLYYRNHGSRPMADIDIAVRASDARAAIACLARAGWLPDGPVTQLDLRFRHALTLRGPRARELDLHWHILFERCDDEADAVFWNHTEPLDYNGARTAALGPELSLLHTVTHGLRANIEPPIRWVADAMTIIRVAGERFDWPLLSAGAARLGVAKRLALGLRHLRDHYSAEVPETVLADLQAAPALHAERLENAMMLGRVPHRAPTILRKALLLTAEFMRLTHRRSWLASAAALPPFMRYRLGIKSWRGIIRGAARRGWSHIHRPAHE